jgi:beta-lactamase regulating signal transducer with metallopeptidase domain
MSSFATWLDGSGRALITWLSTANVWTAALLAGALVLDRLSARRVRASWRIALYLPIVLRLVLPAGWSIPLRHVPRAVTFLTALPAGLAPPAVGAGAASRPLAPSLLLVAYLLGAIGVAFALLRNRRATRRALAAASPIELRVAGASPPCPILRDAHLGPMVVGLLSPRIVLPAKLLDSDDAHALSVVLRHESAHLRRRDPWLSAAMQLLLVVCWPVLAVWIATWRVRQLMEIACDEQALENAGATERRDYGHALLDLAEGRSRSLFPAAGSLHFGSSLRSRIEALSLRRRWPVLAQASVVVGIVLLFVACSSLGATWTPPPGGALRSYDDLKTYCAPFFGDGKGSKDWNNAWMSMRTDGLPAEQVALCRSPTVLRFANDETASEARHALAQIGLDFFRAYEMRGRRMCPTTSAIPRQVQPVGVKYQPRYDSNKSNEWAEDPGWDCMNFAMSRPMFFQYEVVSDSDGFVATARGKVPVGGQTNDVTMVLRGAMKDGDLHVATSIEETWKPVDSR